MSGTDDRGSFSLGSARNPFRLAPPEAPQPPEDPMAVFRQPVSGEGYIRELLKHKMQILGVAETLDGIRGEKKKHFHSVGAQALERWRDADEPAFRKAADALRGMMEVAEHLRGGRKNGPVPADKWAAVDDFAAQTRKAHELLVAVAAERSGDAGIGSKLLRDAHSDGVFLQEKVIPALSEGEELSKALRALDDRVELDDHVASQPAMAGLNQSEYYAKAALYPLDPPKGKATAVRRPRWFGGDDGQKRERDAAAYKRHETEKQNHLNVLGNITRLTDPFVAGVMDQNALEERRKKTNPGDEEERLQKLYEARMAGDPTFAESEERKRAERRRNTSERGLK